jgi:predicted phage terminase large subunit-like protein
MASPLVTAWAEAKPGVRARARWQLLARPSQLTPDGRWNVWLFMAGRGAGKTRSAAEDMAYYGQTHPGSRLAVVAPTYADARDTCVEGESGLLSCLPREDVQLWNRSLGELILKNGTKFKLFSSDEPERLRGPQHHRAWCDELAAFRDFGTWDMLQMGLRLGDMPQTVVTTTPRPVRLMRELMQRSDVVVTRGSTWDNAENLAPAALEFLRRRYEGTRLGRQELEGQFLEDVEGALWTHAMIDDRRANPLAQPGSEDGPPVFYMTKVLGMDPSDGTEDGAEQGLAIAGIGSDWDIYVTHSDGLRLSGLEYCKHAVNLAIEEECAYIVVEKNHGGTFLVELLEQAMRLLGKTVAVKVVSAVRDKRARAEPVAAIYEQGKVHHLGHFVELEEQQTSYTGFGKEDSPDRLDALVWAIDELRKGNWHGAPDADVQDGAVVSYESAVGPESAVVSW